jgi:hypothetical protein
MAPLDRIRDLEKEENLERVEFDRSEEEREPSSLHLQCGADVIGNGRGVGRSRSFADTTK